MIRNLILTIAALLTLACGPMPPTVEPLPAHTATTATDVLQGVRTLAGSREVVAQVASWTRIPSDWLQSPAACAVAELLRQGADAAIPSLEASVDAPTLVAGELDLAVCGLGPADVDPGTLLVLSGTLDQVQGSLLLARVPEHDPAGYAIACVVLELLREAGPKALAEAIAAGPGKVAWSTQTVEAGACRDVVVARAFAPSGVSP